MTMTQALSGAATNVDVRDVEDTTVVDFDIDANSDYEIQSCAVVRDGAVIEAAVRFGRVEAREDLGLGPSLLASAWHGMVEDVLGRVEAVEADLSDFGHTVPHLRIERENVEEYGLETLTEEEFAAAVAELADLVETVLRGDDATLDREIDQYL